MMLIVSDIFMLIINVKMINGQKEKNPNGLISITKNQILKKNFIKKNY